MKLLALLTLLFLRRIEWRRDVDAWRERLDRLLLAPLSLLGILARPADTRLALLMLLWAVAGLLVRWSLDSPWLAPLLLVVLVVMLWLLIGADRLGPDINEYLRRSHLDDGGDLPAFARARFGVEPDCTTSSRHRAVLRAIFVRAYRETFAWLIVFCVLGLAGLLMMAVLDAARRLPAGAPDARLRQVAGEFRDRLDWLVARLFALSLLLTGNSSRAWPLLDSRLLDDEDPADELVATVSAAAAGFASQEPAEPDVALDIIDARGLLLRTQVLWVLLLALSVIVGF